MRTGDWHQRWSGHQLCNHRVVIAVEGQQNKLKNTKPENHESDANYYCTFVAAAGAGMEQWNAPLGYCRFQDMPGRTHG